MSTLLISSILCFTNAQEKSIVGSVDNVPQIENELDGCACRLDTIFVSTFDGKTAWMNISGEITKLSLTKSTNPSSKKKSFYRIYNAEDLSVTIDFIILPKSPNESEESDGYQVNAVITFVKGKHREVFKVKGLCAC